MIKLGNSKLHKTCGIFDLPTSVCFHACPGCYAKKAERLYKNVLQFRNNNLENYKNDPNYWLIQMAREIASVKGKIRTFRIHSSGDFFSQEYISNWSVIVTAFPEIRFYAYTKNYNILDFSELTRLPNFNLINSIADDGGYNYGKQDRIETLQNQGYFLCPDTVADNPKGFCMSGCTACLTKDKVCFKIH